MYSETGIHSLATMNSEMGSREALKSVSLQIIFLIICVFTSNPPFNEYRPTNFNIFVHFPVVGLFRGFLLTLDYPLNKMDMCFRHQMEPEYRYHIAVTVELSEIQESQTCSQNSKCQWLSFLSFFFSQSTRCSRCFAWRHVAHVPKQYTYRGLKWNMGSAWDISWL